MSISIISYLLNEIRGLRWEGGFDFAIYWKWIITWLSSEIFWKRTINSRGLIKGRETTSTLIYNKMEGWSAIMARCCRKHVLLDMSPNVCDTCHFKLILTCPMTSLSQGLPSPSKPINLSLISWSCKPVTYQEKMNLSLEEGFYNIYLHKMLLDMSYFSVYIPSFPYLHLDTFICLNFFKSNYTNFLWSALLYVFVFSSAIDVKAIFVFTRFYFLFNLFYKK